MRYHNKLYLLTLAESNRNDSGDFISQSYNHIFACYCRDEANSAGRKISNGESSRLEYSFIVYAPADCPDIIPGDKIEVRSKQETIRLSGEVIRFSRDRYNCRIWV